MRGNTHEFTSRQHPFRANRVFARVCVLRVRAYVEHQAQPSKRPRRVQRGAASALSTVALIPVHGLDVE